MLAKDYRTRCTLDAIVVDDWVTFEGSEPLFDQVDFSGTSFPEFLSFAAQEDQGFEDYYNVLIMDRRVVFRTMLSQKINNVHHAVCACLETVEEVKEMMASARAYNASSNFDYIFIEVQDDNVGLELIKDIRRQGFSGRLIAVNYTQQDNAVLVHPEAADAQLKFPIPVRDITKILSTDGFEEVHTLQRTDSNSSGLSHEDIDRAITFHGELHAEDNEGEGEGDDEITNDGMTSSRPSLGSISVDVSYLYIYFLSHFFFLHFFFAFCKRWSFILLYITWKRNVFCCD